MNFEQFQNFDYYDFHSHSNSIDKNIFRVYSYDVNNLNIQPDTYFSVGIHPWFIKETQINDSLVQLESLLKINNCIAIGEIGLDKIRGADFELQKIVFEKQISLSVQFDLPIVIHCVKSHDILLKMLKIKSSKEKYIIHGYNKNYEVAKMLISKGFFLSFGSLILKDQKLQNIIKLIPLESFFLETDDSYFPIQDIYETVAKLKNISVQTLAKVQRKLYVSIFNKLITG